MDFDHLGIYIQADYDDCSIGSIMVPPAVGEGGDKKPDAIPTAARHTSKRSKQARLYCLRRLGACLATA